MSILSQIGKELFEADMAYAEENTPNTQEENTFKLFNHRGEVYNTIPIDKAYQKYTSCRSFEELASVWWQLARHVEPNFADWLIGSKTFDSICKNVLPEDEMWNSEYNRDGATYIAEILDEYLQRTISKIGSEDDLDLLGI